MPSLTLLLGSLPPSFLNPGTKDEYFHSIVVCLSILDPSLFQILYDFLIYARMRKKHCRHFIESIPQDIVEEIIASMASTSKSLHDL